MKIAWAYTKGRPAGLEKRAFGGMALGGSESTMLHFAEQYVKLGHEVTIYTAGASATELGGVKWRPIQEMYGKEFDVAIGFRFPDVLPSMMAPLKVLCCHDPEIPDIPDYVRRGEIHLVTVESEHQKQRYQKQHPIPESMYLMSNAGITYSDYVGKNVEKVRGRCIYCSVPARGLGELVHIWPLIHEQLPWATLHITGGFGLWGIDVSLDKQPVLQKLMALDGVTHLGIVPREDLIREQLESEVLLLPGNPKSPEMCCISAEECAAAGNALIVCDIGALPERVLEGWSGHIIDRREGWRGRFAGAAIDLLPHPGLKQIQDTAQRLQDNHDHSILAPLRIARFEEELAKR